MKEKVSSRKKRKQNLDENGNSSPKKKKQEEKYTEIRFKFELRDANLTFLALEKFAKQAEEHVTDNKDYDIVAGYCRSSPECTEILQLLEGGRRKETEYHAIFGALEAILLRILDDLTKHAPVGKAILQKILSVGMPSVYFMLGPQIKAAAVKTTLRMLGALVMLGEGGAKALLLQLDTTHQHVQSLFTRRNAKDPQDVRTCLIHFVMAFLMVGSNSVTQQLVNIKGFLASLFTGLIRDKHANITLILKTVLEKVVENETITKTQRLKLFNEYSLSQICQLYNWTEPKDSEETDAPSCEEREMVVGMTHKLLTEICCSHSHGINFYDKTLGTGGKNQNQLLTNFLTSAAKAVEGKEVENLICQILQTCPDQIKHYLPRLIKNITPRPTSRWCSTMNFLCEIYRRQPDRPFVLRSNQHHSSVKFVEMVTVHLLPIHPILTPVLQSVKHTSATVRYFGTKFLGVLLQKSVTFLHCLEQECLKPSSSLYTQTEREEILELFKENILKVFPDCELFVSCWRDLLFPKKGTPVKGKSCGGGEDNTEDKDLNKEEDVPVILETEHMVEIQKALCFLQELSPSVLVDNTGDITLLLEGVRKISAKELPIHDKITRVKEDIAMEMDERSGDLAGSGQQRALLPQLYLLKLLAGTDARKLPWTQQSSDGHTLMYLLLDMLSKISDHEMLRKVKHLLVKLLHGTGLFEGHIRELDLWISHFIQFPQTHAILQLVSSMFTTYISNSMSYVDKLCSHMSKVVALETEGAVMDDVAMETGSVTTVDSAVNAILEMDEEDFENMTVETEESSETGLRLPFTPLIIVAMETRKKAKETSEETLNVSPEFGQYLSGILIDILHYQVEPVTIATLVKDLQGKTVDINVINYLESLLRPQKVKKKSKKPNVNIGELYFTGKAVSLQLVDAMLTKNIGKEIEEAIRNELNSASLKELNAIVRQILLYCGVLIKKQNLKDIDLLKFCWKILSSVLASVNDESAPCETEVVESSESVNQSDLDIRFIETPKVSREEQLNEMLENILSHPAVFSHFLYVSGEITLFKSTSVGEEMVNCVTEGLCHVLTEVKTLPQVHGTVSKCLARFFDKCSTPLSDKLDTDRPLLTSQLHSFLESTQAFINRGHVNKLLRTVLSFSVEDLMDRSTKSLTGRGRVLLTLLAKVENPEEAVIPVLDFKQFQIVFSLLDLLNLVAVETACLNLLTCYPMASVAMPKDVFVTCLESGSTVNMEILCIVICQSVQAREWFETWICERKLVDLGSAVLPVVVHYMDINPKRVLESKTFCTKILKMLKKWLHILEEGHVSLKENNQSKTTTEEIARQPELMKKLVLKLYALEVLGKTLEDKVIELASACMADVTRLSPHYVEILVRLCGNQEKAGRQSLLFKKCLACLVLSLKNKETRQAVWIESLLNGLNSFDKDKIKETYTTEMMKWSDFAKTLLRYRYSDKQTIDLLTTLADCVYRDSSETSTCELPELSVQQLHEMIISHSQYLPIMFNECHPEVKEPLVDFMTVLVEKDPACCHTQHIGLLLGGYSATLSPIDQKILRLLCLYEKNKADLKTYRPYLWGMKAVEIHSMKKSLGASLAKQTTAEEVMECLDQTVLQTTILKLPLRRLMQPGVIEEASAIKSVPEAYDPCFLLPVFSELVRSESVLDCRKFIENQCLSFTFACLSCHDNIMRGAAYHVLTNFLSHLQGARFPETQQVLYFVELIRNSIEKPNSKLPCIITLFLSRVATLLLRPEDHMYSMMNAFLLLKPAMDTGNVPEFYKLFNSSALEYKLERAWMLSLLSEGLRETADFHILEKRHILKMLLSFYESSISDNSTQLQVLQILRAASKERKVTSDLVRNHGIVNWYSVMVQSKSMSASHKELLLEIVHNTWTTMTSGHRRTVGDSSERTSLPVIFTSQMIQLIKLLLVRVSSQVKLESYSQLLETFASVIGHADFTREKCQGEGYRHPQDSWTIKDALLLLGNLCNYGDDFENFQCVTSALKFLRLENILTFVTNELSSTKEWIVKNSLNSDHLYTQRNSEEMKKVIRQTAELLIRWNPSYLVSTQSKEATAPLCIGVIIISAWLLKQRRNVIGWHFWELYVDWLHSMLMSSDHFTEALLDCPKELQMILEGLVGLYSHLSNVIVENNKVDVSRQGEITLADKESFTSSNWSRTIKKLNEMVFMMCEQKSGSREQTWKAVFSEYSKITESENHSILMRKYLLQHPADLSS
ncbi:nucleolar pre-ribosomal-associated protein 1-like isoform X5 [Ostrea edulis]|uniref:nucleolar pre-ribosomal-associated protein 1-like isoform X5 n=1 Tax=Ostrea edulis TaxID=37623 RepID=UPI0024AFF493|nr:nucleolar pre-ribosomal-associated protein 1-like isoform X5 [Ostrea edulis]